MDVYQNLHWSLLGHKVLEGLKPKHQMVTWIIWNYVITFGHFGKDKYVVIPQTKMKKALRVHQSYIREAVQHLESQGMIKCVLQPRYSKGISGSWVLSTACVQIAKKLYTKPKKAVDKNGKAVDSPDYHTKYTKEYLEYTNEESQDSSSNEESRSPSNTKSTEPPQRTPEELEEFRKYYLQHGTFPQKSI